MNTLDRLESIREAQELIIQAEQLVDSALSGTKLTVNYHAYGKYGFDQLLGNGNPYDDSLDNLIEGIENEKTD